MKSDEGSSSRDSREISNQIRFIQGVTPPRLQIT